MDLGLRDRVALVTGGSQGIGKSAAILLAREGARVAITYRQRREAALEVVAAVERTGGAAIAVPLDLGSPESILAAVGLVVERCGGIDVLVNNAVEWGARPPWQVPPFEEVPPQEWRDTLRANVEGTYAVLQAVVPSMRSRGWGRIVTLSSIVAVDGAPGAGPYAAAKAALHGLTRSLAKELGPAGILVNVVMPGPTMTERALAMVPSDQRDAMAKMSPIRSLPGPDDVVPVIAFLCSALNTTVTGEVIRASGGLGI